MRRGTTLLELLIGIALVAMLLVLAIPGAGRVRDRLAVDAAAQALANAHVRARLVAVTERRPALLTLTDDSLVLRVLESPSDTALRWRDAGPRAGGVSSAGLPRVVTFAPNGTTLGVANSTTTLSRGAAQKQVIVSRYGRVRIP